MTKPALLVLLLASPAFSAAAPQPQPGYEIPAAVRKAADESLVYLREEGNEEGSAAYLGDGRVVTVRHVVTGTAGGAVNRGRMDTMLGLRRITRGIEVIREDEFLDVAAVKISLERPIGRRLSPLRIPQPYRLKKGDELYAIGGMSGITKMTVLSVADGVPTFLGAASTRGLGAAQGDSGGPIVNANGELVGLIDYVFFWDGKVAVGGIRIDAVEKLLRGESLPSTYPPARGYNADLLWGLWAAKKGDADEALSRSLKAFAADPASAMAAMSAGQSYATLKDGAKAIEFQKKAIALDPAIPEPYYELGKLESLDGNKSEALRLYEKATALAPEHPLVSYEIGRVYYDQGRWDDCIAEFRKSVRQLPLESPMTSLAFNGVSACQAEKGLFDDAWATIDAERAAGWGPGDEFLTWLKTKTGRP